MHPTAVLFGDWIGFEQIKVLVIPVNKQGGPWFAPFVSIKAPQTAGNSGHRQFLPAKIMDNTQLSEASPIHSNTE